MSSANGTKKDDESVKLTDSKPPPEPKTQRKYKLKESQNEFCCDGRCVMGPDRGYFYLAIFLVFAPSVAFIAGVVPELASHLSVGWVVVVPHVFLTCIIFANLFMTAFMDPGIIPRQPDSPSDSPFDVPPPSKSITITQGNISAAFARKYCDTCKIYKPVRTIHCGVCNNCVDKFDHHCPWVGNCVGRRNYKYFLMFLFSVLVGLLFIQGLCIVDLIVRTYDMPVETRSFGTVLKNPVSFILIVYSIPVEAMVGALAVYHIGLIYRGVTTNESIKNLFATSNPYDKGFCGNLMEAFCLPYPPRFVKWRAKIPMTSDV